MNKAAIVAAIVAGEETYEGIDLRPGRRFAAGVEEESHKDIRFNNVPDTCVACDSDFPRGVCFRLAAEQWVEDYMPRRRGRPGGGATVNVHLLVPVTLLKRFDAKRGDVPRLTMIRRLMQEWVEAGPPAEGT